MQTTLIDSPVSPSPRAAPNCGRVSVVIGTFNRANYIAECLDSMLRQTRPLDEIVVVDDGSTDNTADCVRAYGDRVRYVHKENGGRASALNHGLERSLGDWIWFFDDDDVAEPDALERMLAALVADPKADFAYSSQIIGREGPDGRMVRERVVPLPAVPPEQLFHHALKEYPFLTQGMLIHRRCFEAVGAFDPRYLRGQDYEFYMRLLRRFRGTPVKGATFVWRVHDGPRGPKHAQHQGTERGKVWMQYGAMMGRELRAQLPLGEYLHPRRGTEALDPGTERRALIHRMVVMASKGLLPEMLDDLRRIASLGSQGGDSGFGADEAHACSKAMTFDYFLKVFDENPSSAAIQIIDAAGKPARDVLAYLARGLLWAARFGDLPRKKRWQLGGQALRLMMAAGRWPAKV